MKFRIISIYKKKNLVFRIVLKLHIFPRIDLRNLKIRLNKVYNCL